MNAKLGGKGCVIADMPQWPPFMRKPFMVFGAGAPGEARGPRLAALACSYPTSKQGAACARVHEHVGFDAVPGRQASVTRLCGASMGAWSEARLFLKDRVAHHVELHDQLHPLPAPRPLLDHY